MEPITDRHGARDRSNHHNGDGCSGRSRKLPPAVPGLRQASVTGEHPWFESSTAHHVSPSTPTKSIRASAASRSQIALI